MNSHLGELVALITAVLWTFTSLFFARASQHIGSQAVNRLRLLLATGCLSLTHFLLEGTFFPVHATPERWGWLALSAIIGLALGDGLLFYAYTLIGPRLAMVLMATVPVMSVLLAWLFLGETLNTTELLAIFITVIGVGWVVLEQQPAEDPDTQRRASVPGLLCGLGAAAGQAIGLILSKRGMTGDFPALSASLIRVTVASLSVWIIALPRREVGSTLRALRDPQTRNPILLGTIFGPSLGMTLSLVAVQLSEVGIASTLMALSPVMMLPIAHWQLQEHITARAVIGTLAAMCGVGMLFLL